jgi:hypothetical protein
MRRLSSDQRSAEEYVKRWQKARKLTLPSWWFSLAPRQTASFWRAAEAMRKEAGVHRGEVSGMTYIIHTLRSSR